MKNLIMIAFIVLITMGAAFAQPGGGSPAERLQKEIDGLTKELSLTKDQVKKITPILTEAQKNQADAVAKMRGSNLDRNAIREERMKMVYAVDKQLKSVLTPEQGVKLDAYRKAQVEARTKKKEQQK